MADNPFKKNQYASYRAWEEVLTDFLVAQAKNPQPSGWVSFSMDPETKEAATYSALVLHGMLEGKPNYRKSADEAYATYKTLAARENNTAGFQAWLRTGWLDLVRVESVVLAKLRY